MNKKLIALAVAGVLAAPLASAAPTVYGIAHVSVDKISTDNQAGATTKDNWEVQSNASRLGIKGDEDLGNGLKAVYKMEFGVNIADGGAFSGRNQYVGLAGDFGTFVVGRHDTPMKMSTGRLEFFGDQAADNNDTVGFADVRANNAIAYISPKIAGGLTIAAAIVPGEGSGADGATGAAEANGLMDAKSVAAMYAAGPLYVSVAYETFSDNMLASTEDYKQTRVGAGYNIDAIDLAFVYEKQDDGGATNGDRTLMQLSGKYTMGANVVKAMYGKTGEYSDTAGDDGQSAFALGLDHNFSKSSQVYAQYVAVTGDDNNAVDKSTVLSFGMMTKF